MTQKRAFITGVTGQDGALLSEMLLEKGYKVFGLKRHVSISNIGRITHLMDHPNFELIYGDLTDTASIIQALQRAQPGEVYNLASQTNVGISFENPEFTANVNAVGALRVLESLRLLGMGSSARFYQASTSELYGLVQEVPQKETTPFYPRSPYSVAKLYAYWMTINYRESYGMHASNGIIFNHESPIRGETFVTRKITMGLARILSGDKTPIHLGNINSKRDWGHAKDSVEAIWRITQQEKPDDYVIATGETHSVREFIEESFALVGISIEWKGTGVNEVGLNARTGETLIQIDPKFFRPAEVELLIGDATKAKEKLGWIPHMGFKGLVLDMVTADLKSAGLNIETLRKAA